MSSDRTTVEYSPGLDGLRGVCLIGVLLFHAPYAWAGGGFLGVSSFFTLSGYLITTLLLRELRQHGTIDLSAFWERRMRRLGPALWLGVGLTLITSPLWLGETAREALVLDGLSAVLFFSNWRFMSPEYAYSKLFADPSALQHCWSLAIEAQYYLVVPLVLELIVRRTRRLGLALWLLALIVASVAVGWVAATGDEATYRAYYGTDARAAEILVGALLAVSLDAGWLQPRAAGRVVATAVGVVGLAGLLLGWVYASVGSEWLYRGGFTIYALFSVAAIFAVLAPNNPVRSLLSRRPLQSLGRLSYGAYVFHWPIFIWLSEERTGLQHDLLFALRVGLTLGLAWMSFHLLENPIRSKRWLVRRARFAIVAAVAVVVSAATVVANDPSRLGLTSVEVGPPSLDRQLTFSMFGDSTAMNLAPSLRDWLTAKGMKYGRGHAKPGCALIDRGSQLFAGVWMDIPKRCRNLRESWKAAAIASKLDVAIILLGTWDVRDRRITVLDESRAPGDEIFDHELRKAARETIEMFRDAEVKAVWLTSPLLRFSQKPGEDPSVSRRASDPARVRRFNDIVREVARDYPEDVRVVDFAAYLDRRPGGPFDPVIRDHGVHYTPMGRKRLAIWLGPEILRAAYQLVPAGRGKPMVNALLVD